MLSHGGAIQDAVAVGGPLDVAQPAWPVRVAHQVGIKRDGVVAGVTYERKCLMARLRVATDWVEPNSNLMTRLAASSVQTAISGVRTMRI